MARRGGAGARHAKGEREGEEVGHRSPCGGQDLGLERRRGGGCPAQFAYWFNWRFDLPAIIPRLVCVALRTPPMPERLLNLRLA